MLGLKYVPFDQSCSTWQAPSHLHDYKIVNVVLDT